MPPRPRISPNTILTATTLLTSPLLAQPTTLNKGQSWLIKNGLQIQGMVTNYDPFHLATFQAANYTAPNWLWDSNVSLQGPPPGSTPWARWVRNISEMPPLTGAPASANETPYFPNLIALSLGDEPNFNDPTVRQAYADWFAAVRTNYPHQLLYFNNYGGQVSDAPLGAAITSIQPDMVSFDTYPYRYAAPNVPTRVQPAGGSPTNFYGDLRRYKAHTTGANVPLGVYRQTYHSTTEGVRDPSESELRLLTFASLAFNAKYLTDFTYNSGASSFFTGGAGDNNPTPLYTSLQSVNAEARRFGPALTRLKPIPEQAADHTTSIMFLRGKHDASVPNDVPIGFVPDPSAPNSYTDWTFGINDPYLSGGFPNGAVNNGSKNNGLPGDVIVSWFTPQDEWFDGDDFSNERYLMVVNALADMDGSSADTTQTITLDFQNLANSGSTSLLHINRTTGAVEEIPLPSVNNRRRYTLTLPGGAADLFKFKGNGAPFVGTLPPDFTYTATTANSSFQSPTNWDTAAAPAGSAFAHFGSPTATAAPTAYIVTFTAPASTTAAFVHHDNVTWDLAGHTFTQTGVTGVDSFAVALRTNTTASLTVTSGTLTTNNNPGYYSEIGKATGATGTMTLAQGATWNNTPPLLLGRYATASGTLNVNPGATANLTTAYLGGSPTAPGGTGVMNINGGTVTLTGQLKLWPTPNTAVTLNSGSLTAPSIHLTGPAQLKWHGGSLSTNSLTLASAAAVTLSPAGDKVLRLTSLTIDPAATLDLSDNALILDYTGTSSPLDTLRQRIRSAATPNNTWTGPGITSSTARAVATHQTPGIPTSLGYSEASLYKLRNNTNEFHGHPIDDSAALVTATYIGDATLDGQVTDADVDVLIANYNTANADWSKADFTHDGAVTDRDLDALAATLGYPHPALSVTPAALARLAALRTVAVPEPTSIVILTLAACGFATTRRRPR